MSGRIGHPVYANGLADSFPWVATEIVLADRVALGAKENQVVWFGPCGLPAGEDGGQVG